MGAGAHQAGDSAVMAAAARFCAATSLPLTSKRLLYEYLAYVGPDGSTLSGLRAANDAAGSPAGKQAQASRGSADVLGITQRFAGYHIIKHYWRMRQYIEASRAVRDFLAFLRSEGTLGAGAAADLDAAIKVAETAKDELPQVLRAIRQPCARNEAFLHAYPLRTFPHELVPKHAGCKESSSRSWPATEEQHSHSWFHFTCDKCKVEPQELEAIMEAVPQGLSVARTSDACWEVKEIRKDGTIVFGLLFDAVPAGPGSSSSGSGGGGGGGGAKQGRAAAAATPQQLEVPFTPKAAAQYRVGMVLYATFAHLSDGSVFLAERGYVFPSFFAPLVTCADDFGPYDVAPLLYAPGSGPGAAPGDAEAA